jgi:hydroxymethylglutaryl-CoA synthase
METGRRGVLGHAGYLPFRRLDRSTIAAVAGAGGGKGTRTVASYDEDTTTMGVEAARLALRPVPDIRPGALYFATTAPAYVDKTNATAIHAALRLGRDVIAADFGGAVRSAVAALRSALMASEPVVIVSSDLRTGLPGSVDESAGADGAAAVVVGGDGDGALLAELIGSGSATEEFLDRWRTPGDLRSKSWEEKFGEGKYLALADEAWTGALKSAGLSADAVDHVIVTGTHARAVASLARRLDDVAGTIEDDLAATIGNAGAAQPALLLSAFLEQAQPSRVVALIALADGADVLLFRTTDDVARWTPARSLAAQVAAGRPIGYGKYLAWRGLLPVDPPRRPEPGRVSAAAAGRSGDWKFGFVGSRSGEGGEVRLPPAVDHDLPFEPAPMADIQGTVATFTVDRLAYSPSPPVVFAVVDFDGGGRLPVELTDVDAGDVNIGDRVEMTFRRLFTVDGIHNYFWKARPVRA